jgi:hypothetical protein
MTRARTAAILVILAFTVVAGGQRTAAQISPGPAPSDILMPGSAHGLVLGPERIVVATGGPMVVRGTFSTEGFEGPFVLYLRNGRTDGSGRVGAARLIVNGQVLLRESSLAGQQPGYVIPVALTDPSVVEVWLAGQPGSELTLWIAGNPILDVNRDDRDTLSQVVTSAGATLARVGPDGTHYVLTIPPKALAGPHEIRITPIGSIPNVPLRDGFRYGVHLEPDGLQLLRPAWLEIRPPTPPQGGLVGFGYEGEGHGMHIRLSRTVEDAIRMPILHFSGAGVGAGTTEDVAQILSTSATDDAAAYEAALAGLLFVAGGDQPSGPRQSWPPMPLTEPEPRPPHRATARQCRSDPTRRGDPIHHDGAPRQPTPGRARRRAPRGARSTRGHARARMPASPNHLRRPPGG